MRQKHDGFSVNFGIGISVIFRGMYCTVCAFLEGITVGEKVGITVGEKVGWGKVKLIGKFVSIFLGYFC